MHKRNGLTALRVKRIRKAGRYGDGNGLYLAVNENGAKSWVFLWKRDGERHARGSGPSGDVTLVEAREWRRKRGKPCARAAIRELREPEQ